MCEEKTAQERRLETGPIRPIIWEYGIPCALITVINVLYNIVNQIFIGLALGLLVGSGCAAMFSLLLGAGEKRRAAKCMGNAVVLLLLISVVFMLVTLALLPKIVIWFGATELIYQDSIDYGRITCFGFVFYLGSIVLGNMLRADGRPKVATVSTLTGCVINCILDPIFIFHFHWGVKGAA